MNKSSYEYQTGYKLKKAAIGLWEVYDGETKIACGNGYKDAEIIQDLFNVFWVGRKKEVFERDGYKCVDCGSPFHIECDHIINRSQRGTSKMENLATRCSNCHRTKTDLKGKWSRK